MFSLRKAKPADIPFITHSWLKRYRDAVHPRLVSDRVYFEAQGQVINKILAGDALKTSVAVDPEDPDHIYGYAIGEAVTDDWTLVHWVYVKGPFRRFKIAQALIKDVVGDAKTVHYTHRTKLIEVLDKGKTATFNPFFIWSLL